MGRTNDLFTIVFLLLSTTLYGFLSPEFGPTLESAASLLGILGGLAIVVAAFEIPLVYFYRTRLKDRGRLAVQPLTIFVDICCVVISRIADFQPGYLYGLVVGYVYAKELPIRDEGRANALTAIWMLTISLAAFVSLPPLESASASTPLLQMALAAGLATIFNRRVGGVAVRVGTAALPARRNCVGVAPRGVGHSLSRGRIHVRTHPPNAHQRLSGEHSPLLAAVALFVGFGVVSVAFSAYFRYRPRRVAEPSAPAS